MEEEGWLKVGVAAALAKEYGSDQRRLLESLASMLDGVLPNETEVRRRGGLFSRKAVHSVRVHLGDYSYTLEDAGKGPLRGTRVRIVRGIALKTEEMPVEEWLEALGEALEDHAQTNGTARAALSRFVG